MWDWARKALGSCEDARDTEQIALREQLHDAQEHYLKSKARSDRLLALEKGYRRADRALLKR